MLEFWTVPTANGEKVAVLLEVLGLEYRTTRIDLMAGEHQTPEMLQLNPFGKLPFIRDKEISVYGSVAIAMYLCEREGRLLPQSPAERASMFQWLGMLSSDLGPALAGQFVFSTIFPTDDAAVVDYFVNAARRLFGVLNDHLEGREYIVGNELTVVDLMAYPSVATSAQRLPGALADFPHLRTWAEPIGLREDVQRGMAAA